MSKNSLRAIENYSKIKKFRDELFEKLLSGKINIEDFANGCFQFILQNKIRPIAKAHDVHSILLNYYYWLIQIERKVAIERRLIEYGVGSVEKFKELAEVYVIRRDQMVRRLIWEHKAPVADAYVVFSDTVEIVFKGGEVVYSTKESLDKIKYYVEKMGLSKQQYYMPIINIKEIVSL